MNSSVCSVNQAGKFPLAATNCRAKVPLADGSDPTFDTEDWVFAKRNSRLTVLLNLINLPMTSSVTFKKLLMKKSEDGHGHGHGGDGKTKKKGGLSISSILKDEFKQIGIIPQDDRKQEESHRRRIALEEAKANAAKEWNAEDDGEPEVAEDAVDAAASVEKVADVSDVAEAVRAAMPSLPARSAAKAGAKRFKKESAKIITLAAFSDGERKEFSQFTKSLDGKESRVKTSLDDVLSALFYAHGYLKSKQEESELSSMLTSSAASSSKRSCSKPKPKAKGKDDIAKAEQVAYETAIGFCILLFFAVMWQAKASINGKSFSIYSPLRNELQNVLIAACDGLLEMPTTITGEHLPAVDALSLARVLNESFSSMPVSEVIQDDDDDDNTKRIVSAMHMQKKDLVNPIKHFIHDVLSKPLVLHDAPRQCMHLLTQRKKGKDSLNIGMELVDLLSFIGESLEGSFPLLWLDFGSIVNQVNQDRGSFPHGTQKARRVLSGFIQARLLSFRVRPY